MASQPQLVVTESIAPRVMKTRDACAYLAIKVDKIRELVQRGEIPVILGGSPSAAWRFDIKDLDAYIEQSKTRFR